MLAVPTHRQIPATTCRRWVQGVLGQAGLAQNLPAAWSDLGRHGLCPLHTRFLICTQGKKMQPSKVTWLSSFPAECVSTWPDSSMHLELMKRSMSRSQKKMHTQQMLPWQHLGHGHCSAQCLCPGSAIRNDSGARSCESHCHKVWRKMHMQKRCISLQSRRGAHYRLLEVRKRHLQGRTSVIRSSLCLPLLHLDMGIA